MLASDTENDLYFRDALADLKILEQLKLCQESRSWLHNDENPVYTHWSLLICDISYKSDSFDFALYVQYHIV